MIESLKKLSKSVDKPRKVCYNNNVERRKERKEGKPTMKTLDIVTLSKGFYLTTRYGGRALNREYFKTKTALNTRVKELKKEGYAVA